MTGEDPTSKDRALPLALARLHAATPVGSQVSVEGPADRLADLLIGGGFDLGRLTPDRRSPGRAHATARRARTLADTVGPGMRILVCGLNPSLVAADAGFGFAGPTNRFWPAAVAAGLVSEPRDPLRALDVDRAGMTDLAKRATASAASLAPDEYRAGLARVERLVAWLRPERVLFVGLAGWRVAADRRAVAGWQPQGIAGAVPAYVMPSTSGLNAATRLAALVGHIEEALA